MIDSPSVSWLAFFVAFIVVVPGFGCSRPAGCFITRLFAAYSADEDDDENVDEVGDGIGDDCIAMNFESDCFGCFCDLLG